MLWNRLYVSLLSSTSNILTSLFFLTLWNNFKHSGPSLNAVLVSANLIENKSFFWDLPLIFLILVFPSNKKKPTFLWSLSTVCNEEKLYLLKLLVLLQSSYKLVGSIDPTRCPAWTSPSRCSPSSSSSCPMWCYFCRWKEKATCSECSASRYILLNVITG